MLRRLFTAILLLLPCVLLAQTTRVRGRVSDAKTGEPLPFASVYFDGTTIGITTDTDGRYVLETRNTEKRQLTAHLIGYETQTVTVTPGAFNEVDFFLVEDISQLDAATVKPDNSRLKRLLKEIDRNRNRHNYELSEPWTSDVYSKIELDATNVEDLFAIKAIGKRFGFILDYRDTSAVTGKESLPFLLSETISKRYHSDDPAIDREKLIANHITGVANDNFLRQYSGTYLLKTNFNRNYISVFNVDIPSPASSVGHPFYNYYLVDSLNVEGRKTYTLRFHPKAMSSVPVLDGEMTIDAGDYAIRSVRCDLAPGHSKINWIRHIAISLDNKRVEGGKWFPADENLFIDFSISSSDSTRIISFLGNRLLHYSDPVYGQITDPEVLSSGDPVIIWDSHRGDDEFWAEARPYPLSEREQGIITMLEEVQDIKGYNTMYGIATAITTEYYEIPSKGIGIGPWTKLLNYNATEGFHIGAGVRTTKEFSQKVRLTGYVGYGFRDHIPKVKGSVEYMLGREKTRKLTLRYKRGFDQLGRGSGTFASPNIFSAMSGGRTGDRQNLIREISLDYEHEHSQVFTSFLSLESDRIFPNQFVPFEMKDGSSLGSISSNQIHYTGRFAFNERVNRGVFSKSHIYTRYPVIQFDLVKSFGGLARDGYSFDRESVSLDWNITAGLLGFGHLYMDAGRIGGEVPYPFLKLHESNRSWIIDRSAFACMDYYEFASDRWATCFYEHNFNGFFLGMIPGIRQLNLREIVSVKTTIGSLSDKNGASSLMIPIEGMGSLDTPYVEVGAGVAGILRILRVDANWRLTHRNGNDFSVKAGFDIRF